jgi:hypothetical protein
LRKKYSFGFVCIYEIYFYLLTITHIKWKNCHAVLHTLYKKDYFCYFVSDFLLMFDYLNIVLVIPRRRNEKNDYIRFQNKRINQEKCFILMLKKNGFFPLRNQFIPMISHQKNVNHSIKIAPSVYSFTLLGFFIEPFTLLFLSSLPHSSFSSDSSKTFMVSFLRSMCNFPFFSSFLGTVVVVVC